MRRSSSSGLGGLRADPMSAASVLAMLRKMTADQLARWICARQGCFSRHEREALDAFQSEAQREVKP